MPSRPAVAAELRVGEKRPCPMQDLVCLAQFALDDFGEYLGCFFMTLFSQTMKPLQHPGRFNMPCARYHYHTE